MNDEKFLDTNRTGIFKQMNLNGSIVIPKDIRDMQGICGQALVETIPMKEGVYIRKAVGKR